MNNCVIYSITIGLFVSCLVVFKVNAQENFKGIIPMVTMKSEVEKKLGKPNKYGDYELDEGRVHIDYYERECEKKIECFCLVPLGTVRFISINLYYDLYLKDLNLDTSIFERKVIYINPLLETYADFKAGIVYDVSKGRVSHIYYYESEATCKMLEEKLTKENCSKNRGKEKVLRNRKYTQPSLT